MATQAKSPIGPTQLVRDALSEAVMSGCCERKCKLGLVGISNFVVLKGEKVVKKQNNCDYIIIQNTTPPQIVLVELKSGGVKHDQVIKKFSNTLQWISEFNSVRFNNQEYRVTMLLLVKRRLSKTLRTIIRSHGFKLKGKRHFIITSHCGLELADVYKELGWAVTGE